MAVAFRKSALALMLVLLIAVPMAAQQVSGELMIRPTDPSGAAVVGAQVQIDAPALINPVKGTTNAQGEFRAQGLPPGVYKVTVTGQGFRTVVRDRVVVEVGRTFTIAVPMQLGQVSETVEVAADAAQIDTVRSESAATITSNALAATPGERDFTDYARLLPSVNIEALAGTETFRGRAVQGISVDGASGAENVFFVDGVNTTNIMSGQSNQGIRTEIVQEMQVKTGGYEAEFGGAMGGVVSAVTKSGTNNFHGQLYYYYSGSQLTAKPRPRLRLNPNPSGDVEEAEYIQDREDRRNRNEVGFSLGGPILRDRLFFFANINPQFEGRSRTTEQWNSQGLLQSRTFRTSNQTRAGMVRMDFQPVSRVRMSASYTQDTFKTYGKPTYFDPVTDLDAFDWGSANWSYPSYTIASTLNATITNRFLLEGRFGYNLLDTVQGTAPPRGVALVVNGFSNLTDDEGNPVVTEGDPLFRPTSFRTYDPDTDAYLTAQDLQKKLYGAGTAALTFNAGGTHNFKMGYQWERAVIDKYSHHTYDYVRWNWGIAPLSFIRSSATGAITNGPPPDCTLNTINGPVTFPGGYDPEADSTHGQNGCGYIEVRAPFGVNAKLHSDRHAFFFQDSWTIGRRLTINPGIRFEKENLPSFTEDPDYLSMRPQELQDKCGDNVFCWGFDEKVAPRFGAAYDLFGNGKAKIYGSWGWFYDVMKMDMAEGSFGGFQWISRYYWITSEIANDWQNFGTFHGPNNFTDLRQEPYNLTRTRASNFRFPSFDTVDPGIKPMRMSEYTLGGEFEVLPGYVFSTRYVAKRLDRVIEDVGVFTPEGDEIYYITNPGYGYSISRLGGGVPATPKPKRNYDALELRIRKPFTNRWSADLSYTYSRLRGLYSGLASSDEDGRMDPNVSRDFDFWLLNYDASGRPIDGPLNTDRPHQVKFNGSVEIPVVNINLGGFFRAMSGTPSTSTADILNTDMMVFGRNDMGRNDFFTQTDIYVSKTFKPFKDEGKSVEVAANVVNLFNQKTALTRFRSMNMATTFGMPETLYAAGHTDPEVIQQFLSGGFEAAGYDWRADIATTPTDPRYGLANSFQEPISARFGIKFNF